jgi:peptidoglycan/LPS O-acetylase OafA/YrhL
MFPVWLLGTGLALSPRLGLMESRFSSIVAGLPLLAVLGLVGLRRIPEGYAADYAVAVSFTLALFAVLHRREPGGTGLYARLPALLAGCSYTLYLTRLSVLMCMRAYWTYERYWPPNLAHWSFVAAACVGCVGYAFLLRSSPKQKPIARGVGWPGDSVKSGCLQISTWLGTIRQLLALTRPRTNPEVRKGPSLLTEHRLI